MSSLARRMFELVEPIGMIPYAADARLAASGGGGGEPGAGGGVETVVVAPARDLVAITVELAGLLVEPVELLAAPT